MTKISDTIADVMSAEPNRIWDATDLAVELWKSEKRKGVSSGGSNFLRRVRDALRRKPEMFSRVEKPEYPSKVGWRLTQPHSPPPEVVVATPAPSKSEDFGINHLVFLVDAYKALALEEDRVSNQILSLPEVIGESRTSGTPWQKEVERLLGDLSRIQADLAAAKSALNVVASSVVEATTRKKLVIAVRSAISHSSQSALQVTKSLMQSGALPNNVADPKESVRMVLETMVSMGIVKKFRTTQTKITKYKAANGN